MSCNTPHPFIDRLDDFLNPDKNHGYGLIDINSRALLLAARRELEHARLHEAELHRLQEENSKLKDENEKLKVRADDLTQALIYACKQPQPVPYTFMPYYHPWKSGDITFTAPDTV